MKVQDNLDEHDPEKCHNRKWVDECKVYPTFSASPGVTFRKLLFYLVVAIAPSSALIIDFWIL